MPVPAYPLLTGRLVIRPFCAADVVAIADLYGRLEILRYLWDPERSVDDMRRLLEIRMSLTSLEQEGDRLGLALESRETGALIGDVMLSWVSKEHACGEIGFVLHPDHQRRGYATEAAAAMLNLGFGDMQFHRIIGRCDARNIASARVLEKLGMRREGHLLENEFVKGEWTDEHYYAILAREWAGENGA